MSSTHWFSVTSSIHKTVELINQIHSSKLNKLLSRVILKIHSKDEKSFTAEEEEKLQVAFNLTSNALESVLDTISFIFEQAAYHNAKPNILRQQLQQVELDEEQIECFVNIWVDHGTNVNELLRKRSLAPKQLENVNWELRLQTASADQSKLRIPSGILELCLSQSDSEKKDKLLMEFSHEELFKLFKQLETIQTQLDTLNT